MKKDLEILKKTFAVNSTLAEVSFNKTIINSDDMISSMEIQLASAENSLQNAKQIREVYLRSIKNEINEAKINYQTSINEYEKLTISSPINGIISYINIDLGQEINIGSSIFSIVNETEAEVNISFNRDELRLISE
jgi:multidrug resistance efflux pump